jgi:hypothetical protein
MSSGMWSGTVILTGTVIVESTAFRWCVTDGRQQHLTVYHPTLGEQTRPLVASPESQARIIGRSMLLSSLVGLLEQVDDAPTTADGEPEPTIA